MPRADLFIVSLNDNLRYVQIYIQLIYSRTCISPRSPRGVLNEVSTDRSFDCRELENYSFELHQTQISFQVICLSTFVILENGICTLYSEKLYSGLRKFITLVYCKYQFFGLFSINVRLPLYWNETSHGHQNRSL